MFALKYSYNGIDWLAGYCEHADREGEQVIFRNLQFGRTTTKGICAVQLGDTPFATTEISYTITPISKPSWFVEQ